MGCGLSKNSVHAMPSPSESDAANKTKATDQTLAVANQAPIVKQSPPMKSAMAAPYAAKKRPSSQERGTKNELASNQGSSSPMQQSSTAGILPQKNSVRWKTDEDEGKEGDILRSRSQSNTASPSISAKGSLNQIIVPDTHPNSPRINNTGPSTLDVVMEQNSLSSFHMSDSPGSPCEKTSSTQDLTRSGTQTSTEKTHSSQHEVPVCNEKRPPLEVNDSEQGEILVDEEAAEKIRTLLRAQLARKANRSATDVLATKSLSRKSSSPSLKSRDGAVQGGSGKDLLGSSPKQSPLLIPNSSSYMSMKRHGTGTTSLTAESHIHSEAGSQSDEFI